MKRPNKPQPPLLVGDVARGANASVPTVDKYAKEHLIDYETTAGGIRIYPPGTIEKVRAIKARNIERRKVGRPRNAKPA